MNRVQQPLVGRDEELAAVLAAADAAPSAVLITGEGGIGKSRLLAEVVADLERRGWQILSGRADQLERQIPYAAFLRTVDPLRADPDPEVAALAGELAATLDVLGGVSRADVAASFGQVCGQATRLLRALLEHRPTALAVDDLHSLDDDTLALLAIVLRRIVNGRIAFLGTSRAHRASSPGLDALVSRLEADGLLRLVPLAPLRSHHIAKLVEPLVDAGAAEVVTARAEGNPFFALELAGSAAAGADVTTMTPMTRATTILQRFVPLDSGERSVLRAVAVLGRAGPADVALMASATGLDPDATAAAFDSLVRASLLQPAADGYGFTHDLVREAVYADIGPAEQRRLHRAVADQLLLARSAGQAVDVMSLARHLSEAADAGDVRAAEVLVEAGDRSRAVAPGSAATLYGRALDLIPPGDARRGSVLSRRCRAFVLGTQPAAAVEAGRLALEVLPAGTPERARTATSVIASLFELGRIDEALAAADAEVATGTAGVVIESQRPMLLWFTDRLDEALAEWHRVRTLPTSTDAERILVLGQLAFGAGTFAQTELTGIADELVALGGPGGPGGPGGRMPSTLRLFAVVMAGYMLAMGGEAKRALPLVEEAEAMLEDAGGTPFRGNILLARVMVDWMQGRWDEALDGAALGRAELEGAQLAIHLGALQAVEIDIRFHRGESVPESLIESAPGPRNVADLKALAVAGLRHSLGDLDGSRREVAIARARSGWGTAYVTALLARLVDVELSAGNVEQAKVALAELEDVAPHFPDPWTATTLWRCRALVTGDADAARSAVGAADGGTLVFEGARARLAVGQLDPVEVDAVTAAYRTFQALGADKLRRQAAALLTDRGAKVPRQRSSRSGLLTNAEMAIARLVQQGMRNKEIAVFLHYSPRTVEVYLSRIYAKLAVSSRLELARALDARSLDA